MQGGASHSYSFIRARFYDAASSAHPVFVSTRGFVFLIWPDAVIFVGASFSRKARFAARSFARSRSIAVTNRCRAIRRFVACERESWTVTLTPLGRWRSVTAVETLLTCCPPGPDDRANVSSKSASLSRKSRFIRRLVFHLQFRFDTASPL